MIFLLIKKNDNKIYYRDCLVYKEKTMTNQEKGLAYELYIRDYIINELGNRAYLWDHAPVNILVDAGIVGSHNIFRLNKKERKNDKINPIRDTGIDIIQVDDNNNVSVVQCKNGYKSGITMNDLAGFNGWMAVLNNINGYVYYTSKLSTALKEMPKSTKITYIKKTFDEIKKEKKKESKFIIDEEKLIYQKEAEKKAIEHYKTNNKGIISMPCGTGKTYLSYLISNNFKQIIVLTPLIEFSRQTLDCYVLYGYDKNKTMNISSEGIRDIDVIKKFIKKNKSFVLFSTFGSIDVIMKVVDCMIDPFFIIDEFHNLTERDVFGEINDSDSDEEYSEDTDIDEEYSEDTDIDEEYFEETDSDEDIDKKIVDINNKKENNFNKLINSDNKILFLSATPKMYYNEENLDGNEIFGKMIYNMTFNEAIKKKYITDYRIWLPSVHEDNKKIEKELSIYEIDNVIQAKCVYLYSCLIGNGSRKCIIYCLDTKEIDLMMDAIKKLKEFYCVDIDVSKITGDNKKEERKTKLEEFSKSQNISLLFSVRILDECIDVPSCDSIYITYSGENKIRTIQRMCRCVRIDKNNRFKVGNVYIWCNEYNSILQTLSGIKDYDEDFKNKVKINPINFYNKSKKEVVNQDNKLIEKYIIGIKEYKERNFYDTLNEVSKYMDENNKRPNKRDKNCEIKNLGIWLSNRYRDFKEKKNIMKDIKIYNTFLVFTEKYKSYFDINLEYCKKINDTDTISKEKFNEIMNDIEGYMEKSKKKPSISSKNIDVRIIGKYLECFISLAQKKEGIMKNKEYYEKFIALVNKYSECFIDRNEKWNNNLIATIKYIEENKKRPSHGNKNKETRYIGEWLSAQLRMYKNKPEVMKKMGTHVRFEEFINKYNYCLKNNKETWRDNLKGLVNFIEKYKKRPTEKTHKFLDSWIRFQLKHFISKKYIFKYRDIIQEFTEFLEKNKQYFEHDSNKKWNDDLLLVINYIDTYKKRPSDRDSDPEIQRIAFWLSRNQTKYRKNNWTIDEQKIKYGNFATKYSKYLKLNDHDTWYNCLNLTKKYMDENKKKPHTTDPQSKSLCRWIYKQEKNFREKKGLLKKEEFRNEYIIFRNQYEKYI